MSVLPTFLLTTRAFQLVGGAAVLALLVTGCVSDSQPRVNTQTRTYYIAADEVSWNYAPGGRNMITGEPFNEDADTFVKAGPDRIGSTYTKCLYHGYTGPDFTRQLPRPADQQYLGLLGPVIRAQVGDTIQVTFRNNCSFPASIHPHGVFYGKKDEGAAYDDGTADGDKADDAIEPGQQHVYTWTVPERAGPGPMEGSSVMWMYHSHADEVRDPYSGLMGMMVVTAAGKARADGSPNDVDREMFALYEVTDENNTHYSETERTKLAQPPDAADEGFVESNLMHSINGYVYGNGPLMTMRQGERVRWYVMGMGTEVDLHTPHWHGHTVTVAGMRMDVVNLLPATMVTADMIPDSPGIWLFHCHVNDHITAGMQARYEVLTSSP